MEMILEILKNYWKEIISVVLFIVSVIIAAIRKKPVNDVLTYIYESCIKAVKVVENKRYQVADPSIFDYGLCKLQDACDIVREDLKKVFPNLDVYAYSSLIKKIIEDILSTPQKKVR